MNTERLDIEKLRRNLNFKHNYIISRNKFIDLYKCYKKYCDTIKKTGVTKDPIEFFGYEYDSNLNWKTFILGKDDCGSDDEKNSFEKTALNAKK